MKIETFLDLYTAWVTCNLMGKIIIFPFFVIAWIILFLTSCYMTGLVEVAEFLGLFNESEENEETDRGSK